MDKLLELVKRRYLKNEDSWRQYNDNIYNFLFLSKEIVEMVMIDCQYFNKFSIL